MGGSRVSNSENTQLPSKERAAALDIAARLHRCASREILDCELMETAAEMLEERAHSETPAQSSNTAVRYTWYGSGMSAGYGKPNGPTVDGCKNGFEISTKYVLARDYEALEAEFAAYRAPHETFSAPIVPPEYRERVRDVIRQGLAAYGKPRGIKNGAEADDWLRQLADQGSELKANACTYPDCECSPLDGGKPRENASAPVIPTRIWTCG
jgi:hypothetical protein